MGTFEVWVASMRKVLCAIAFAVAWGQVGEAMAADMPARPVQPPTMYTPNYVWSGFYVGGYGGGQWDHISDDTGAAAASTTGWLVGAVAGANSQWDRFVVGLEADIGAGRSSGNNNAAGGIIQQGDIRGIVNARVRAGIAFDRLLVFAAGGYSLANPYITRLGNTDSDWIKGWTVGGGIDYALAIHWILRLEYLYASYGIKNYGFATDNHNIKVNSVNTVRAAAMFKF